MKLTIFIMVLTVMGGCASVTTENHSAVLTGGADHRGIVYGTVEQQVFELYLQRTTDPNIEGAAPKTE